MNSMIKIPFSLEKRQLPAETWRMAIISACAVIQHSKMLKQCIIGKILMMIYFIYSEFCGLPFCKLCLVKTRPFPMNNPDFKNRGEVCKVCDRKFYVREMIKHSKATIETQTLLI